MCIDSAAPKDRAAFAGRLHRNTRISRADLFGGADARLMPLHRKDDASVMFAGFIGRHYVPDAGVLLLAINPGGGGGANVARSPDDEAFYPLLYDFTKANDSDLLAAFDRVNDAFAVIVRRWNLWRILEPTLEAASLSLEQVAYMNLVPYRTRGNAMPPRSAQQVSWREIIEPTLNVLKPLAIVTLGKKAGGVLGRVAPDRSAYCVPRTIGDTYVSDDARAVHEKMKRELKPPTCHGVCHLEDHPGGEA
jgi:hypothetical protein